MMVEFRFTKKQVESGKKLTKKEFEDSVVGCFGCDSEETRMFYRDCNDCCGIPCWHEDKADYYCCDCWAKKIKKSSNSLKKGLNVCLFSDCSNRIFQKKGDYQTLRLFGEELIVCLNHPAKIKDKN